MAAEEGRFGLRGAAEEADEVVDGLEGRGGG